MKLKRGENILFIRILLLLILGNYSFSSFAQEKMITMGNCQMGWNAAINRRTGCIAFYQTYSGGKWNRIDFRKDRFAGPSWQNVKLFLKDAGKLLYEGSKDSVTYRIQYLIEKKHLVVRATMKNNSGQKVFFQKSRLILGVNSEMRSYPEWNNRFFPTLLRCEKTHCWGYFMSPLKRIFVIGVTEPVASYTIDYIHEGSFEWNWGHQIFTASLDLLHEGPLPLRHPQNLDFLNSCESKEWNIHMGEVATLSKVKKVLSEWLGAPMIEADRYTVGEGEHACLIIHSVHEIGMQMTNPLGKVKILLPRVTKSHLFRVDIPEKLLRNIGLYQIRVKDLSSGRLSEALLYRRPLFSWYMKKARDNVYAKRPIVSGSAESSYGFYAAFLARRYFPNSFEDYFLEDFFNRQVKLAFNTAKGIPLPTVSPQRVQNITTLIGQYTALWRATGDTSYLVTASKFGDYIASSAVQKEDGSYRSGRAHYTAVIYPAKSMLELAEAEKILAENDTVWHSRYKRHRQSADYAIHDLLKRRDRIETEGDLTFEDGMITCSALQLAMEGLLQQNAKKREEYTREAIYMMGKHTCLEQKLVPDARMNGATLRFWEALDVYFSPNQVMCSPHGWTAWKVYADYYLYLLTGKEVYLSDFMNTLGTCLQIMDKSGELRWGFIDDPFIRAQVFVPEFLGSVKGKKVEKIVGEQYLPMISGWFRPLNENRIVNFGDQGGAGDNTVYEIFKALEECALNKAYVIFDKRGKLSAWNCFATIEGGKIKIIPAETVIELVHLNLSKGCKVEILSGRQWINYFPGKGLKWVKIDK